MSWIVSAFLCLSRRPPDPFLFGACAAETHLVLGIFHESLIEIMTDFLAFEANEIDALNALVDFFPIKDSALELLDSDTQQLFVIVFYFSPACLVAGKVLIFQSFLAGVVGKAVMTPLGCLTFMALFLRPRHLCVPSVDK